MKRCPCCGETKPTSEFPRNRRTKDGFAAYCKPCHNAKGRASRIRRHGSTRHYHLRRRYGIGAAEVALMIEAQGGLCAICRRRPAEHVDHDHSTGRVRAVLCLPCNTGMGHFGDDVEVLAAAISYLASHDPEAQELTAIAQERVRALRR